MGRSRSRSRSPRRPAERVMVRRSRSRSRERERRRERVEHVDRPERHRERERMRPDRVERDRPPMGRERRRSRSPSPSRWQSGRPPSKGMSSHNERPEIDESKLRGKTDDEREMMKQMGFCGFDTTKNKQVQQNGTYVAHILRKRRYRQYMNRRGGFNRPLDFIA